MKNSILKFAGLTIGVEHFYSHKEFLPYIINGKCDFSVSVSETDIELERKKVEKEYNKITFSPENLEFTAIYRKIADILPNYNAVVFHGSAVAVGEEAFLFAAKSGTGKTTHTNLWGKNIKGSYMINGDKPIIRIIDGDVLVCGNPWQGKENYGTNKCVKLKSICHIIRSNTNHIEMVSLSEILDVMINQTYQPSNPKTLVKVLGIIKEISNNTKLYKLYCNTDDEAALVSYNTLKN